MPSSIQKELESISDKHNRAVIAKFLENGILIVEFNRKEKYNALNGDLINSFLQFLQLANKTAQIRVVIITGGGFIPEENKEPPKREFFTSGNDQTQFNTILDKSSSERFAFFQKSTKVFEELVMTMLDHSKILIGAVNGPGVGFGLTILGLLDFVYASEDAFFFAPFVALGICAEGGSTYMFPKLLGRLKANELLLLGDSIDAKSAEQVGLINKSLGTLNELKEHTMQVAQRLLKLPQAALTMNKKVAMKNGVDVDKLKQAVKLENEMLLECWKSDEAIKVLRAFNQKKQQRQARSKM